ncbi:putative transposase [Mycobacterium kansasii 732]|nr:putative transposase [Mycobacterium kansasii 732]
MGLAALYPKPRTTIPGVGHRVYPYLLRGLTIDRPNQLWATDLVRREALFDRVEVRDHHVLAVAAAG